MISFSIIIPLFNKENSIIRTIESVLCQSYTNYEIIVIDDGSSDGSSDKVRSIDDARLKLISKPNGGVCSARNKGISLAKNDYIAFLDADDIWYPDYLLEQYHMIKDFPLASMWGINWYERTGEQLLSLCTGYSDDFRGYVEGYWKQQRVSDLFFTSSVVLRKSALETVGYFDEKIKYSEDLDMWYRVILNFPVAFNSKKCVIYEQDSENRAMKREKPLNEFLPYYISKYESFCRDNKDFSHFINTFAAGNTLQYYFGSGESVSYAKEAVKHLRYNDIHWKYRLLYKSPFPIGKLFYRIMQRRHSK